MTAPAIEHSRGGRRWARGLAALAALIAWPLFLWWSYGGMVPAPRVPSWHEIQTFFGTIDDYALSGLLVRTALRLGWTLWFYFVFILAFALIAQVIDRRHPGGQLRLIVDTQPRFVLAVVNAVVLLVLAAPGPRSDNPGPVRDAPAAFVHRAGEADIRSAGPTAPTEERVVQRFETLSSIARDLLGAASTADPRVPKLVAEIVGVNQGHEVAPGRTLTDPRRILPGWRILVPKTATTSSSVPAGTRVVTPGDTLSSIARDLLGAASTADPRVPKLVAEIVALNQGQQVAPGQQLADPDEIRPGWRLRVPAVTAATVASPPAAPAPARTAARVVPPEPPAVVRVDPPGPAAARSAPAPMASPAPPPRGEATTERVASAVGEQPIEETGERSRGVTIPGGAVIPVALGCAVFASLMRARIDRLRRWRPRQATAREEAEAPASEATRAAGLVPSFDVVGPFAERVLEAWHEATGEAARIEAAWEREESVSFLLAASGVPRRAEVADDTTGIRVRFDADGETIRAHASGPRLPSLRRSLVAITDGLLVPVGHRAEGALHVPLLGSPLGVSGPGAERLVETALVTAGLRAPTEEVRIVAVGDIPPLLTDLSPLGELDLPAVERVARAGESSLREELEAEIVRRARRIGERGGEDLHDYALVRPDDRLGVVILLVDQRVAREWAAVLAEGARFGIASVVLGAAGTERRLVLGEERLTVEAPAIGRVTGLAPYLLPRQTELDGASTESATKDAVPVPPRTTEASVPASLPSREPVGRILPTPSSGKRSGPRRQLPDEPFVSVLLFGNRVRVVRGEEDSPAEPDREKARELIAYLAGCPDGATADQLCDVLWPDRGDDAPPRDPRNLKSSLSACVAHARRWLEAAATNPPDLLPLVGGRYRLAFEHVWVDVVAFEDGVAEARAAADPEPALRRALEHYRGDLCQGLDGAGKTKRSAEQFLWVERDGVRWDLRRDAVWAADRLAAILLERGDPATALEVLQPLLANGSVSEALECRAMECHAALRDREGLHRRWVRLQNRLSEELDLEPVPETYALYRTLTGRSSAAQPA